MKKLLALGVGVIILLLAFTLAVFAIMHTRYFTPSAQWLTEQLWPNKLTFSGLEYEYPTHFTLHQVKIETEGEPVSFDKVDIWLNQKLIASDKLVIDSLLLDGANFAQGLPSTSFLRSLEIHQIALHNIDFSQHDLIARDVNLQIKNPIWKDDSQYLPFGQIQLSADQLYWQGEAFNNVLADADYKPQKSTIYGASFKWHGGDFSGQAEQFDTGWSLVNTTISHLNLPDTLNKTTQKLWANLAPYITHINSLDILSSHLQVMGVEFNNLEASLENIDLNKSLWQQDHGYLSLNADSAMWHGLQWIDPGFKMDLKPQSLSISELSTDVLQGNIQLSGTFTPNTVHLSQLNVSGIKWFAEKPEDFAWIPKQWPQLDSLNIDKFELNNIQLIQLMNQPKWQLSGVTVEGENAQLIRGSKWGLWNGSLTASANSASYGELISTQGVVDMQSKDGKWQLNRAFIPFENGYLDAKASWDFTTPSQPWILTAHANGLPLTVLSNFIHLPMKVDAISDFDVNANGLSGDYPMFSRSLSGELNASLRDGTLVIERPGSMVVQPFELDNIKLKADRGRIKLPSTQLTGQGLQANLLAQLDLVSPQEGQLELNITQGCDHIRYDFLNNKKEIQSCVDVNSH